MRVPKSASKRALCRVSSDRRMNSCWGNWKKINVYKIENKVCCDLNRYYKPLIDVSNWYSRGSVLARSWDSSEFDWLYLYFRRRFSIGVLLYIYLIRLAHTLADLKVSIIFWFPKKKMLVLIYLLFTLIHTLNSFFNASISNTWFSPSFIRSGLELFDFNNAKSPKNI